jgi:hypothetical protein
LLKPKVKLKRPDRLKKLVERKNKQETVAPSRLRSHQKHLNNTIYFSILVINTNLKCEQSERRVSGWGRDLNASINILLMRLCRSRSDSVCRSKDNKKLIGRTIRC